MYDEYYGLSALPFQLSPDRRFFFGSAGHKKAMAYLTYGLNQGEGFIIITGDIGAGKTTLVAQLLATLDTERYVAAHVVTTQLDAEDLLRMVASAFGLPPVADKATLLRQVETFLEKAAAAGRRALLIVDEAQNLPVRALEELRMLSNFQRGESALLQSFLLGQPQFRETLAHDGLEQLRQRVIASYHLGPLGPEDTRGYVEHRLRMVGWNDDPRMAEATFDAIHRHSGGVPRRINALCSRLFLYGYLEEKHEFSGNDVDQVAADLAGEAVNAAFAAAAPRFRHVDPATANGTARGEGGDDGDVLVSRVHQLEAQVQAHERAIRRALEIAAAYMQKADA